MRVETEPVRGFSAPRARTRTVASARPRDDAGHVTYAVVWHERDDPVSAGRLELTLRSVVLTGSTQMARESGRSIRYEALRDVRVERRPQQGRESRRALVLECRDGTELEVTPVGGAGVLHELAEQIAVGRRRA